VNVRRWLLALVLLIGPLPGSAPAAPVPELQPLPAEAIWKWGGSTRRRGFQIAAVGMALGLFILFKPGKHY